MHIAQSIEEQGIHNLAVANVFSYLQKHLPIGHRIPSETSIRAILKKHFHLKFKASKAQMVRYLDPTYNEKRLWVSRLLAQFHKEDAVIISIDESNFRLDSFPKRKWVLEAKMDRVGDLIRSGALDKEQLLSDPEEDDWIDLYQVPVQPKAPRRVRSVIRQATAISRSQSQKKTLRVGSSEVKAAQMNAKPAQL